MSAATVAEPPTDPDAPLAHGMRSFLVIWAAQLVARIGNGLTAFGLGVHVYQTTGRSAAVAAVMMAAFLPAVLLAPLGGVLADRVDRRLLMIAGDALSALGLVMLLVAFHHGIDSVAVVCACVAFSSVFTSVMDPAYRATVTDLLTPRQFARAGGLVQFASASQYLISPVIAGALMAWFGIEVVVSIDIATLAVTTLCMVVVWRTIRSRPRAPEQGLWADLRFGVAFLARRRGMTVLMLLVTGVTFCMGFLQTLLTPMLLDLTSEEVLGVVRSAAAVGMVVSSLAIGVFNMGGRHRAYLSAGLAVAGVAVAVMGVTVNVLLIGALAFVFFTTLPPLNTSIEVMVRSGIPNATQGRVWGLMGLISQLGYIAAYAVAGLLADSVFNPLLTHDGAWASSVGAVIGTGHSRGIGLMFIVVGALLLATALALPRVASIKAMEDDMSRKTAETKR